MKSPYALIASLLICNVCLGQTPLPRKDCFLGFHFDFHARDIDTAIGSGFTDSRIDSFLATTHPDFVQVDYKGHHGFASYPTQAGTPAHHIRQDIMEVWREETRKFNIGLYVAYSGIIDAQAISEHPEWASVDVDGKPTTIQTSIFSRYVNDRMIPQLKESISKYDADGAWIDGDCWALTTEYSAAAKASFTKSTGITNIPKSTDDPGYLAYARFIRHSYHQYLRTYIEALHAAKPGYSIASNWAFSYQMPEKVDVPVDFLSGDVSIPSLEYTSALAARTFAGQDLPWDLMTWAIEVHVGKPKPFAQIVREISEVIAVGGGTQTFWPQNPDGSINTNNPNILREMSDIAQFCRQRQPYCFKGKSIPQVGLILSTYAWERFPTTRLYAGLGLDEFNLTLATMLDNRRSTDVLLDWKVKEHAADYPLLVYPQWSTIDPSQKSVLLDYVKAGGNLLVIGASTASIFSNEANVTVVSPAARNAGNISVGNLSITINAPAVHVKANSAEVATIGTLKDGSGAFPMATITSIGKGKLAALYFDAGDYYMQSAEGARILDTLVNMLLTDPIVTVIGAPSVHMFVTKKDNSLYVHLINANGLHSSKPYIYTSITPVGPFQLKIKTAQRPTSVVLQPIHQPLKYSFEGGFTTVSIPDPDIYSIVQIN